ncbi:MAG: aminotransferase class V-fold PLP-dependent enzyme [Candidatus Kaiserbacteria bacterium]|nr:aminotransferase class V-fold PLP-dependent enzyme [Candidatus Kaiserbacteria bacterium]
MFKTTPINLDRAAGASANTSSPHEEGRRSREQLERARADIARLIEVQPDDVIFTSGATEANALAILGSVRGLTKSLISGFGMSGLRKSTLHVLYLPSAHASVVENIKLLSREGVEIEELPIANYRVNIEALKKMIRKETVLISMDAVCGETGTVWNTREVASVIREPSRAKRGILLHVDASQAPLTEKISRAHFDADMLTFDSSKVGTTRGIGALIAHRTIPLEPLYRGGGQERGLRPGSEPFELARNFAADLSAAVVGREKFCASAKIERIKLIEFIKNTLPTVYINEGRVQSSNILNISLPNRDTDYIVALLDEEEFAVSTRSACETDSENGSRAVFALTGDTTRARATLRISWGPDIRPRAFVRFRKALARAVAFVSQDSTIGTMVD